jgi:Co/Zn/Cd efflux system component
MTVQTGASVLGAREERMADCCSGSCAADGARVGPRFRRALWIALWVNLAMFVVEMAAGLHAGSMSLLADAIDFAGDSANYGISLVVLAMGALWRARAAFVKGLSMGLFGVAVLGRTASLAAAGASPEPFAMGAVALLALCANVGVAVLLYACREGDANMRSVWLCSRNDAIGNAAVMLAALLVARTGHAWPDLAVAAAMALLALSSALSVLRQSRAEMRAIAASGSRAG